MPSELKNPSRKRSREVTGSDLEFKRILQAAVVRGGGDVEAGDQSIQELWLKSRQGMMKNWTGVFVVGTVRSDSFYSPPLWDPVLQITVTLKLTLACESFSV